MAVTVSSVWYNIQRLMVWSNKEPVLTIRRVLWVLTAGWALFIAYIFATVGMAMSIIGIPFCLQTLKFAVFCLDPIPRETYSEIWTFDYHTSPWSNPIHPFTCIANVIWLVFFGWEIVLLFWVVAIIQALTVVGIGTAIQMFQLSMFALWPFGRDIRRKRLPTTMEELQSMKAQKDSGEFDGHGPWREPSFDNNQPATGMARFTGAGAYPTGRPGSSNV